MTFFYDGTKVKKYLLCCVLLVGCSSQNEEKSSLQEVIPVSVAHPSIKDFARAIETTGTLTPIASVSIFSRADGVVAKIHVHEGQNVSEGSPLVSLDSAMQQLHVQQAKANLATENAVLHGLVNKMSRYTSLAQKDLIPQIEWDEIQTEVEKSKSTIENLTAGLQKAVIELDNCTVKAPFDGRVGEIPVCVGTYAQNGSTCLTTVTQLNTLVVSFSVTEKEFFEIPAAASSIEISPLSHQMITRQGSITFFNNSFDSSRGTLVIKGSVPNEDHTLLPGQIVRVRIHTKIDPAVIFVPQSCLQYNQKGPYVYVITPEMTAAVRQIAVGDLIENNRIVGEGLAAIDSVVIEGQERLSEGCKVSM